MKCWQSWKVKRTSQHSNVRTNFPFVASKCITFELETHIVRPLNILTLCDFTKFSNKMSRQIFYSNQFVNELNCSGETVENHLYFPFRWNFQMILRKFYVKSFNGNEPSWKVDHVKLLYTSTFCHGNAEFSIAKKKAVIKLMKYGWEMQLLNIYAFFSKKENFSEMKTSTELKNQCSENFSRKLITKSSKWKEMNEFCK